ncbi:MAG: PstS family phosphate ABC transporter substrate-binding protein [Planctomycetota bacterium]
MKEQPGSSAVVQGIANDKYGIGYSGIGYLTADVASVPLARDTGSPMVAALPENAYAGEYPLARFLYVYVNHRPDSRLDPLRREFVRYIFSREGQMQVLKDGYFPITAAVAKDNLTRVGIAR